MKISANVVFPVVVVLVSAAVGTLVYKQLDSQYEEHQLGYRGPTETIIEAEYDANSKHCVVKMVRRKYCTDCSGWYTVTRFTECN